MLVLPYQCPRHSLFSYWVPCRPGTWAVQQPQASLTSHPSPAGVTIEYCRCVHHTLTALTLNGTHNSRNVSSSLVKLFSLASEVLCGVEGTATGSWQCCLQGHTHFPLENRQKSGCRSCLYSICPRRYPFENLSANVGSAAAATVSGKHRLSETLDSSHHSLSLGSKWTSSFSHLHKISVIFSPK